MHTRAHHHWLQSPHVFKQTAHQKYIYSKKLLQMSSSSKSYSADKIFGQYFKNKTENGLKPKDPESDSDSGAEEQLKRELKKKNKRKRKGRRKGKVVSSEKSKFKVFHVVATEKVTAETHPEINLGFTELVFTPNQKSKVEICSGTHFFNTKNKRDSNNYKIPPWEWPAVRGTLQQNKPLSTFNIHEKNDRGKNRPKMESVTRQYEETYLKEPDKTKGERQCLSGEECQGLQIDCNAPFILKEFYLPSEEKENIKRGSKPTEIRLCLMCKRYQIGRALLATRADCMGWKENVTLQDYFNLIDVEGEYKSSSAICSDPQVYEGLWEPIVLHCLANYRLQYDDDGKRYYEQWKMGYPTQNFQ